MPVNSCAKGKVGERAAAEYLRSLGFADARRTQQHCGTEGTSDVVCPESLPGVHIEVKFGVTGLDLGTARLQKACEQAARDSDSGEWVVLWKPKGARQWRMTLWDCKWGGPATFGDDRVISDVLRSMV